MSCPGCVRTATIRHVNGVTTYSCGTRVFADGTVKLDVPCVQNQLYAERRARLYYQDIVYHTCNVLDGIVGHKIVCGTADTPVTGVQDALKILIEKIREIV